MLKLSEYRQSAERLTDHLPWAALVAPGVVLNKDGSFQRSFRFRGPDLESATPGELVAVCARVNNVLRRFGSGWAVFFEAERFLAPSYPQSEFANDAAWLVDEERRAQFEGSGAVEQAAGGCGRSHLESAYYVTLAYMAPVDGVAGAERALVEVPDQKKGRDWRYELGAFVAETDRAYDLLSQVLAEIAPLSDTETLTYLHGTVSTKRHPVVPAEGAIYLDALLADTPLRGGTEPILGEAHLRTVTILGFPNTTRPGILDALNHLEFPYRWNTRFIALDKTRANKALTSLRRQWFNKRKSITQFLREVMHNEPVQLLDSDADNKMADADAAMQALGDDNVAFGYLTATVTVMDADRARVEEKVRAVERAINGLGFTCIRETLNAVESWLGSLPGHLYANVRQPLVHTLNLAHLMPLSAVWAGPAQNQHLSGPPLFVAETTGSTPFRYSTHVGDVGHSLIVGPTGAGKSVLLALMALQFQRYGSSQVFIFDKGNSARAAVLAMGGAHHDLGLDGDLAFQPLREIDGPAERSWAADWVATLLEHQNVELTPEVKDAIWSALSSLASAPVGERTLTGLSLLLQSNALKAALQGYTLEGPFGRLLDAEEDHLAQASVQCFETEGLLHHARVVLPVLTYLFHRLEARFTGKPTLLILDEAWVYLDNQAFAARIREWLKVLRKKNVAVVFATQSLADISNSSIAPAIIESCPQRIFLPNERAVEPQAREFYDQFGLNDRQIELVSRAVPKRQYYLQSRRGNRLFELGLGPIGLTFCGASSPGDQAQISRLVQQGRSGFAQRYLRARGLDWAANLLNSEVKLEAAE